MLRHFNFSVRFRFGFGVYVKWPLIKREINCYKINFKVEFLNQNLYKLPICVDFLSVQTTKITMLKKFTSAHAQS